MERFNPFPFITHLIWIRLLRDFRRLTNDYCLPVYNPKKRPMEIFSDMIEGEGFHGNSYGKYGSGWDKDSCVNLSNWGNGRDDDSRLEIRGMGNNRYHLRVGAVFTYIQKIIRLFTLCCDRAPLGGKSFRI